MEYLVIQSKGKVEVEAFSLIGNSTKKGDDTKIGMFGSGLKYAISSLLRNNVSFMVFSGKEPVDFRLKPKVFRGQNLNVITINGVETSFTDNMGGEDWDIAFAPIREIYSNALDEDSESTLKLVDSKDFDTELKEDKTTFFIEANSGVLDFFNNKQNYFCKYIKNVSFSTKVGSVFPKELSPVRLYRKGILCFVGEGDNLSSNYNYNSPMFKINEARVLSAEYSAKGSITTIWKLCENEAAIRDFILYLEGANVGRFEYTLDFESYSWISFSSTWGEVVKDMKFVGIEHTDMFDADELIGRKRLPYSFLKALLNNFPDIDVLGVTAKNSSGSLFSEKEPSQALVDKVIDALAILRKTSYKYRLDNIEILYGKFSSPNIKGQALDSKILLSTSLDIESVDYIAKIIIEENEHNKTGFSDESREFKNHWITLFYNTLIS